jgi:hypothetical protein
MSTPEKIVKTIEDEPLLEELNLPDLFKEYKRYAWKENEYTLRKNTIKEAILEITREVKADTIVANDWKASYVLPTPGKTLNPDLLRTNIMRICKLDAATVAKIFTMSETPKKASAAHVRITGPKDALPKKAKDDDA